MSDIAKKRYGLWLYSFSNRSPDERSDIRDYLIGTRLPAYRFAHAGYDNDNLTSPARCP